MAFTTDGTFLTFVVILATHFIGSVWYISKATATYSTEIANLKKQVDKLEGKIDRLASRSVS